MNSLNKLILKRGKARYVRAGAPIIYSGAIEREVKQSALEAGSPVLVCDGTESSLGWGLYNPHSQIFRVRLMQTAAEQAKEPELALNVPKLLEKRLAAAVELRRLLGLPNAATDTYRLCNSEGDRLSGLIVDVLGSHLVVQSSALWVEKQRDLILTTLRKLTGASEIHWQRNAELLRREEGWIGSDEEASSEQGDVQIRENGVKYWASPRTGQKTGFYADQRDSRLFVRGLSAGLRVLDLCCYSGGFALNAALGGAAEVVGVDSSEAAIQLAQRNAELNSLDRNLRFEKADISAFMDAELQKGAQWDLIILDPPKLAPSRKVLPRATSKYRKLNSKAMQLLRPGGLLMSCSCSGAMTQSKEFVPLLQETARDLGRNLTVLRHAGCGVDHTLDPAYPEGEYLTNITCRVL